MVPVHSLAGTGMEMPSPTRLGRPYKPWRMTDGMSLRPGYHLTPQKIVAAFRQAEMGEMTMQSDLFEDIEENDGHLRSQYEARLEKVAYRPWFLKPGGKDALSIECAARLSEALKGCNVMDALWHLLEAIGHGFSLINTAWRLDETDMTIVPYWFLRAPHRRCRFDESGTGPILFRTEQNQYPGEPIVPGQFILAYRIHRLLARAGAFRTTTWWAYFKRMSVADWIVFAEKFGIPYVLGYYQENASDESRAALLRAVSEIGSDGQAVLSKATDIVVKSEAVRGGDLSSLHPMIAQMCNAEISKVITGSTLTTDNAGGNGSYGLGKEHANVAGARVLGDAFWIGEVMRIGLIRPFIDANPRFAKARSPEFMIRLQPDQTGLQKAETYEKLQAMGVDIEGEQMYEEFGLRRPEAGDALKPIYDATPPGPTSLAPSHPRGRFLSDADLARLEARLSAVESRS